MFVRGSNGWMFRHYSTATMKVASGIRRVSTACGILGMRNYCLRRRRCVIIILAWQNWAVRD
jgi:hypothetical protein